MLPTLEKSERFQKEFREFNEKITQLTDTTLRNEMNNCLMQLLSEVRVVDQHMFDPKAVEVSQSRDKIAALRKKLDKTLNQTAKTV
jgi:hypothetical protein